MADFSVVADVSAALLRLLRAQMCPAPVAAPEAIRLAAPTDKNGDFQLDEQNKLFVAVSGINYANQIQRRVLEADGLVYEYCYPYQTGTVLDDGTGADVMYYSIRKG